MVTKAKLTAFAAVLAAMFGAGAALGAVVGPIDVGGDREPGHEQHGAEPDEHR